MPAEVAAVRDEMPLFEDYLNSAFPCDDLFFNEKEDLAHESPLLRTYSEDRGVPSSPNSSHSSNSKDDSTNEADSDVSLAIRQNNETPTQAPLQKAMGSRTVSSHTGTQTQGTSQDDKDTPRAKSTTPQETKSNNSVGVSSFQLNLHGIPSKSRVETQIRLGLQVVKIQHEGSDSCETEIGDRFQWLKLPSWAMAKEKLKLQNRRDAPPTIDPTRIIFLDARVVKSTDPLEDVVICAGCVTRERKRAQRKKDLPKRSSNALFPGEATPKSDTSELLPLPDENKKILVFNCPELLEVTNGEVTIPTRVTCYCRHHKEKDGFRIIITLRDALNNILASTSSELVLITDDHKTTGKVQKSKDQVTSSVKGQPYVAPTQDSAAILPGKATEIPKVQYLGRTAQPMHQPISRRSSISSVATSSRKRKAEAYNNGSSQSNTMTAKMQKVPGNLSMTNLDTNTLLDRDTTSFPPSRTTSQLASPVQSAQHFKRSPSHDSLLHFMRHSPSASYHVHEANVPTSSLANSTASPQNSFFDTSMDEVMHDRSAPMSPRTRTWDYIMETSTPPRTSVPDGTNSLIMPPTNVRPQSMDVPVISRMIPSEGPLQGGIEVTILGNGFYPGMTAMFGEVAAIPTHCWSSTTLVCVLPPATNAGPVPATFKEHPLSIGVKMFTYIDETDRALYELALQVIGLKTTGKLETARDVAMRICSSKLPSESVDCNLGTMPLAQLRFALGVSGDSPGAQQLIQGCLNYLDGVENERPVRLSLRSRSGHTMLHLATIKGYSSLVQNLLKRGASVNIRDRSSFTPLHTAALYGDFDICHMLRSQGSANLGLCTNDGRTSYDIATVHDNDNLLELLDPWVLTKPICTSTTQRSTRSDSVSSYSLDEQTDGGTISRCSSASFVAEVSIQLAAGTRQRSMESRDSGTRTQPASRAQSPVSTTTRRSSDLSSIRRSTSLSNLALMSLDANNLESFTEQISTEKTGSPKEDGDVDVHDVQTVVNNLIHLQQTWMDFLAETSPMWLQKTLANANASLPEVLKTTPNLAQHMPFAGSPISAFQAMLPQMPHLRPLQRTGTVNGEAKATNIADSGWLQTLVSSLGAPPSYAEATSVLHGSMDTSSHASQSGSGTSGPRIMEAADDNVSDVPMSSSSHANRQGWFGKSIAMSFRSQGRVADMTPEQQRAQVKRFQKSADRMMFFFWLPCLLFFIMISIGKAFFDKLLDLVY